MTAELHSFFDDHPFVHVSTSGGAEVGCVAALSVLDQIEAPGFLARVVELGERFAADLADLPFTLRRRGLFMGFKFDDPGGGLSATQAMIREGVFAIYANNDPSVLQFLPPLVLDDDDYSDLLARTRLALRA